MKVNIRVGTDNDVFIKTRKVLSGFLKISEDGIKPGSLLRDDLGADSVDFWEIIAKIEKEFDIELPNQQPPPAVTVEDVVRLIEVMKTRGKG